MDIHEYQAKTLLREFGVVSPAFALIESSGELSSGAEMLSSKPSVIKVQVHAGKRGKAGGVKLARSREEVLSHVKSLLGMKICNEQTGPKGMVAHKLMITEAVDIVREFYMSIIIDSKLAKAVMIVSPQGGMEIEEIAKSPEKILKIPITAKGTIRSFHLLRLVNFMGWKGAVAEQGKALACSLAKAFIKTDASMIEINPLVETAQGTLSALDVKMSIDDNALFRQPQIAALYDPSQISPQEAEAKIYGLAYVALDGNIGCIVNGAGLAMATVDMLHLRGGKAANFLDVGGGASQEQVEAALQMIVAEPKVKGILINIFGGIMNCETLALGIQMAAKSLKKNIPIVVRMEGTNVEKGKEILATSGVAMTVADSLPEAVDTIISYVAE